MSESNNEQKMGEAKRYSTKEIDALLESIFSGLGSILNAPDTDKEIAAVAELKNHIAQNKDNAVMLNKLCSRAHEIVQADSREKKLQHIVEIEQHLSEIKDVDVLLESILSSAREIVHADAGSIYEYDEKEKKLSIRFGQNDTQQKKLEPGEKLPYTMFTFEASPKLISGYCALTGKTLNLPDVYNLSEYMDDEHKEKRPYAFNQATDKSTGYHTTSMLTLPLKMTNGRVLGVMQLINAQNDAGEIIPFDDDAEFDISRFASNASQALEYAYLTNSMVLRMARMAEYRDPKETGEHVERVATFSLEIYDRYASNKDIPTAEREKFRDTLKMAAKCHDFGKVGISDIILKKAARFTDDERNTMKGHTCLGAQLFTPSDSDLDEMAREVTLRHHERWDGEPRGYPGQFDYNKLQPEQSVPESTPLKGEEIPLAARIVSLADVFDALSHQRVYKEAWSIQDTFNEIEKERGHQFDPEVVDAFLQIKDRIIAINSAM